MSMDHRREPADARTANNINHATTNHNNGNQPLPLDKRSSIWATKGSCGYLFAGHLAADELTQALTRRVR